MQKILILLIFLICNFAHANCLKLLELQITKQAPLLLGEPSNQFLSDKKEHLRFILEDETKELTLQKKRAIADRSLQKFINSKIANHKYQKIMNFLRDQLSDPIQIQEWAFDLYTDLLAQIYISKTPFEIDLITKEGRISEQMGVNVVQDRVRKAGFEGVEVLDYTLQSSEFAQVLLSRKLILDREFEMDRHGSMIHLLQIDLIVYILKKHNMDIKLASEVYHWMGTREIIKLENDEIFDSLKDGWGALFDSTNNDITSPELFNPILRSYFKWYIE